MLTKFTTKRLREKSFSAGDGRDQSDKVVERLVIRYIDQTGGQQNFLDSLQSACTIPNLSQLFYFPVQWKSIAIQIEQTAELTVDFDAVTFDALLLGIKVRRSFKKELEIFTYDIELQKEVDREFDMTLSDYLDKFEEIDEGKWARATFVTVMQPIQGAE